MSVLRLTVLALAAILPAQVGLSQNAPPIYANFHIKESGTQDNYYFRVLLDRTYAPTAVANFLGLVSGERSWIDPATGTPTSEPFYQGTRIYKVVPGFPGGQVYFGSPTNDGLGGPGYVFQDIGLGLRPGDGLYGVYMENDGPNTNGSRIFISAPKPVDSNRYTRLGVVQEWTNTIPRVRGYNEIIALSNAADDGTGKPINDLTIESITIDGWFPEDPNFLIDAWDLPTVGTTEFNIVRQDGIHRLVGFTQPGSAITFQASIDFETWTAPFTHVDLPGATTLGYDMSTELQFFPRAFFRGSSVLYPEWPAHDLNLDDSILQFNDIDQLGDENPATYQVVQIRFDFQNPGGGGTWLRTANGFTNGGEFNASYSATGPFTGTLSINPLTGTYLSPTSFTLHFEHHFPVEPVINRFNAGEFHSGDWTYLFYPN